MFFFVNKKIILFSFFVAFFFLFFFQPITDFFCSRPRRKKLKKAESFVLGIALFLGTKNFFHQENGSSISFSFRKEKNEKTGSFDLGIALFLERKIFLIDFRDFVFFFQQKNNFV